MRNAAATIEAVLFDMDGLLFDTEHLYFQAMRSAGQEAGHYVSRELYASLIGHTWETTNRLLVGHFGAAFAVQAFHDTCHRQMDKLLATGLRMKPGVLELLELLDLLDLPRALVTSSRRSSVQHHLAAFSLADRFHAVVAHGDYARGKPDPEPYLRAASQLGVKPAGCLALEDSYNGVRSAAGAGMQTIMVPDMLEPTQEMRGLCMAVLDDLHAVGPYLTESQPAQAISSTLA